MVPKNIPSLVKHCTMAIYAKGDVSVTKNWFEQSFKIARAMLARQGYLSDSSVDGATTNIRLTAKGMERNRIHSNESSNSNQQFNKMYDQFLAQETAKMPLSRTEATDQKVMERKADIRLGDEVKTAISAQDRREGERQPIRAPKRLRPTAAPGRSLRAPRGRRR